MARSQIYRIYQIIDCIFYDQIRRVARQDQLCVLVTQITMRGVLLPMVSSSDSGGQEQEGPRRQLLSVFN